MLESGWSLVLWLGMLHDQGSPPEDRCLFAMICGKRSCNVVKNTEYNLFDTVSVCLTCFMNTRCLLITVSKIEASHGKYIQSSLHQNADLKSFTKSVVGLFDCLQFNFHMNTKMCLAQSHCYPSKMKEQWVQDNISTFCVCKAVKVNTLCLFSFKSM